MKYGVFLVVLTFLCCSTDDAESLTSTNLQEKWIETKTRLDTLSFESLDNMDIMNLQRGNELRNDRLLPKFKSGPYTYKISEERISLNWMLSSNSAFSEYYFKIIDNRLNLGNFYGLTSGETLTFERAD